MLNTLYPIYGLTKGLTNKLMVKTMHQVLESRELVQEYLPEEIPNILRAFRIQLCGFPHSFSKK